MSEAAHRRQRVTPGASITVVAAQSALEDRIAPCGRFLATTQNKIHGDLAAVRH